MSQEQPVYPKDLKELERGDCVLVIGKGYGTVGSIRTDAVDVKIDGCDHHIQVTVDNIVPIDRMWTDKGIGTSIRVPKQYKVDIAKIVTLNDVIALLAALQISFTDDYEKFDDIKHLLKME